MRREQIVNYAPAAHSAMFMHMTHTTLSSPQTHNRTLHGSVLPPAVQAWVSRYRPFKLNCRTRPFHRLGTSKAGRSRERLNTVSRG